MQKVITKILFVIFTAVFLLSGFMLARYFARSGQEEAAFAALQEITENAVSADGETKYASLKAQNPDFAAWLSVDGTAIDYPVVYTPSEPEYYLRRGFDGEYSYSGTPFVGENSTLDSDVCIIYGHNMKNGTMFSTLRNFSDKEFRNANRYISLTTVTECRRYEIFAAIETDASAPYQSYAGDITEEDFDALCQWLSDNALYDCDITTEYGDKLLLLSTCSYHTDDGRFVVAAKRIE